MKREVVGYTHNGVPAVTQTQPKAPPDTGSVNSITSPTSKSQVATDRAAVLRHVERTRLALRGHLIRLHPVIAEPADCHPLASHRLRRSIHRLNRAKFLARDIIYTVAPVAYNTETEYSSYTMNRFEAEAVAQSPMTF